MVDCWRDSGAWSPKTADAMQDGLEEVLSRVLTVKQVQGAEQAGGETAVRPELGKAGAGVTWVLARGSPEVLRSKRARGAKPLGTVILCYCSPPVMSG